MDILNFMFFFYKLHPEDEILSVKYVGDFMCMDGLWFYVNCVSLLVYVDDYIRNE